jgi:hypothetical protein
VARLQLTEESTSIVGENYAIPLKSYYVMLRNNYLVHEDRII